MAVREPARVDGPPQRRGPEPDVSHRAPDVLGLPPGTALVERLRRVLDPASDGEQPGMDPETRQRLRGRLMQEARARVQRELGREPA